MVSIHNLIAAISPDLYCDSSVRDEVKKITKEKGYTAAAEKAKPVSMQILPGSAKDKPLSAAGIKAPLEKHMLVYDSATEGLEPVYFWILDFISKTSKSVTKITDTFASSVGSGHFSELGGKATRMQEEAMKMLGSANNVLKSVLNVLYDLKEFEVRLASYEKIESKNSKEKQAGMLALKQIWLDSVDIKRGNSSIKAMAQQFDFVTILDAFMKAESVEDAAKIDLNDRVKRIVIQRVGEFQEWIKKSEIELKKRYEVEKIYLKSQVNSLKLYSRWIKPYLEAARQLEQMNYKEADLVSVFNTLILQLTLMTKDEYDPKGDVNQGLLPGYFKSATKRKYYSIMIIDFKFRSIPQRAGQGYAFGGKVEVTFTSYALTDQEIKLLEKEQEKDDINEVLSLIEGATTESLGKISDEINKYTKEEKKEDKKPEKKADDDNPFSALFSFFKSDKKADKKKDDEVKKESSAEKVIRSQTIISSREKCFNAFEIYKKAHRMASFP